MIPLCSTGVRAVNLNRMTSRNIFGLFALLLLCVSLRSTDAQDLDLALISTKHADSNVWVEIRHLGVEGQGWTDTKAPYDRLPARAEGTVRGAVWGLSRNSAGLHVRFVTDATTIQARWAVTSSNLALPHMAATDHMPNRVERFNPQRTDHGASRDLTRCRIARPDPIRLMFKDVRK